MARIVIRDGEDGDRAYVLDTTHKTLLESSAYFYHVSPQTVRLLLDPIMATYKLLVAVTPEDPTSILGYVLFESSIVVAFIYVRSQFRKAGIGRALLDAANTLKGDVSCPLIVTSMYGQNFPRLAQSKGYKLRFRPYLPLEISAAIYGASHA